MEDREEQNVEFNAEGWFYTFRFTYNVKVGDRVVYESTVDFASDFICEIEKNLDNWHCTGLASVPASMELMRGQMKDRFYEVMSRFRFIEVGAGALTPEQRKRLTPVLRYHLNGSYADMNYKVPYIFGMATAVGAVALSVAAGVLLHRKL